jgi:hypothetical protein
MYWNKTRSDKHPNWNKIKPGDLVLVSGIFAFTPEMWADRKRTNNLAFVMKRSLVLILSRLTYENTLGFADLVPKRINTFIVMSAAGIYFINQPIDDHASGTPCPLK